MAAPEIGQLTPVGKGDGMLQCVCLGLDSLAKIVIESLNESLKTSLSCIFTY